MNFEVQKPLLISRTKIQARAGWRASDDHREQRPTLLTTTSPYMPSSSPVSYGSAGPVLPAAGASAVYGQGIVPPGLAQPVDRLQRAHEHRWLPRPPPYSRPVWRRRRKRRHGQRGFFRQLPHLRRPAVHVHWQGHRHGRTWVLFSYTVIDIVQYLTTRYRSIPLYTRILPVKMRFEFWLHVAPRYHMSIANPWSTNFHTHLLIYS